MKVFTVHAPPGPGGDPAADADRMVFVKEGFSWPALFFPAIWLLWHRMWWVLLGWLAIAGGFGVVRAFVPGFEPYATPAAVLLSFLFALEANGLRRWTLGSRGYAFAGIGVGRNREECEHSFFARRGAGARPRAVMALRASAPATRRQPADDTAFGLFPRPR